MWNNIKRTNICAMRVLEGNRSEKAEEKVLEEMSENPKFIEKH